MCCASKANSSAAAKLHRYAENVTARLVIREKAYRSPQSGESAAVEENVAMLVRTWVPRRLYEELLMEETL